MNPKECLGFQVALLNLKECSNLRRREGGGGSGILGLQIGLSMRFEKCIERIQTE